MSASGRFETGIAGVHHRMACGEIQRCSKIWVDAAEEVSNIQNLEFALVRAISQGR